MKCMYAFGGKYLNTVYRVLTTCIRYTCQIGRWTYIASLEKEKYYAACTIFEGKIVLCGGFNNEILISVESYDHHENKWTDLPDMLHGRHNHVALSIDNKMFVIGGKWNLSCEVFDRVSRKFTYLKQLLTPESFSCNVWRTYWLQNHSFPIKSNCFCLLDSHNFNICFMFEMLRFC